MSTAREIIDDAYASLGLSSEILPIDDALITKALDFLISCLETIRLNHINLQSDPEDDATKIVLPSSLTDELGEPSAARTHLVNYLAIYLIPISRASANNLNVPPLSFSEGKLWQMFGEQPIPIKRPSRTLPRGQGGQRLRGDTFFRGETLSKDD